MRKVYFLLSSLVLIGLKMLIELICIQINQYYCHESDTFGITFRAVFITILDIGLIFNSPPPLLIGLKVLKGLILNLPNINVINLNFGTSKTIYKTYLL